MDMVEDWDHVAEDVSKFPEDVLLIGHVDCSKKDTGDPLCKRLGITNLPAILYFDPPVSPSETNGSQYFGNHSYLHLRRFARFLSCNGEDYPNLYCSKKQRTMLPHFIAMEDDERQEQLEALQLAVAEADGVHRVLTEQLQAEALASEAVVTKLQADITELEVFIEDEARWWIKKKWNIFSDAVSRKFSALDRSISRLTARLATVLPSWMGGTPKGDPHAGHAH